MKRAGRRDAWMVRLEADRALAREAPAVGGRAARALGSAGSFEVVASEAGRVSVIRLTADDLERCLREYAGLPWSILAIRPLRAAGRAVGTEGKEKE